MTATDIDIRDETIDVETPQERAQRRVQLLHRCAAGVMAILADIYRDNDWQHLNDRLGRPYNTFAAFIKDQLGGSESGARRYQQGIINLIVPLQEITGPDTTIPVTSTDIARLGQDGARTVVERAPAALEGQSDQTLAIRRLIDTVLATDIATEMIEEADQRDTGPAAGDLVPTAPSHDDQDDEDNPDAGPHHTQKPDADEDDEDEDDRDDAPTGRGRAHEFKQALNALLCTDPVALAAQVNANPQLASDCVAGAQLLARISQLIR